jgi:hypothetical protein
MRYVLAALALVVLVGALFVLAVAVVVSQISFAQGH